jgi:predicted nucleic acid-binding protein
MFSIRDLKRYRKCPRLFYKYYTHQVEEVDFIKVDENITELLIKKFNIDKKYIVTKKVDVNKLKEKHIFEAKFDYTGLDVEIPYMVRKKEGFDIYFTDLSVEPKISKVKDYAIILWVLKKNDIKIDRIKVIYLNKNYVKEEDSNINLLFKVSSSIHSHGHYIGNVTNLVNRKNIHYTDDLIKMKKIVDKGELPKMVSNCNIKVKCELKNECYNYKDLPNDSILYLNSSKNKFDMYKNGIVHIKDADLSTLEGNKIQYQQVKASRNGGLSFDKLAMVMWLKQFENSIITFIDFEWETYAIPKFNGLKPYDVVCFQYSMDILYQDHSLTHHEYIGQNDTRLEFVKRLIHDTPKDSIVVAYNAAGAEKIRLKELAIQLPEYSKELLDINSRMVDISIPFVNGMVYELNMRGSFTLKAVYNAISKHGTYDKLNISTAMDAVTNWRNIDDINDDSNKKVKEDLLRYCGLDTKSMVVIYKWLLKIVNNH